MKKIVIAMMIIAINNLIAQTTGPKAQDIQVGQDVTTYISISNIKNPKIDIGTNSVIGEILKVNDNSFLIKLKAEEPFKVSSMLIMDDNNIDIPVFKLVYNNSGVIGKYVIDAKSYQPQNIEEKTIMSKVGETQTNKSKPETAPQKKIDSDNLKTIGKEEPNKSTKISKAFLYNQYLLDTKIYAGLTNPNYTVQLVNILKSKEKNQMCFQVMLKNKLNEPYRIEDVVVSIVTAVKGRGQVTDIVDNTNYDNDYIEGKETKCINIETPIISIGPGSKLKITILEKSDYGSGREIEMYLRSKDLVNTKNY